MYLINTIYVHYSVKLINKSNNIAFHKIKSFNYYVFCCCYCVGSEKKNKFILRIKIYSHHPKNKISLQHKQWICRNLYKLVKCTTKYLKLPNFKMFSLVVTHLKFRITKNIIKNIQKLYFNMKMKRKLLCAFFTCNFLYSKWNLSSMHLELYSFFCLLGRNSMTILFFGNMKYMYKRTIAIALTVCLLSSTFFHRRIAILFIWLS